jgi:hypothetical protein
MDKIWTPYAISVVIHHTVSRGRFHLDNTDHYREMVRHLTEMGLFEYEDGIPVGTDMALALLEMWCTTPLPQKKWVDPRFGPQQP